MTVDELYEYFIKKLSVIYNKREADNISDWVFESVANIKRLDRITHAISAIDNSIVNELNNALEKLLTHKPVQYVLGEAWFYKMKLKVNEHVLIPRPETEELVGWVVEEIGNKELKIRNNKDAEPAEHSPVTILDVGTGSGCIAIALKKQLSNAEIFALDISDEALQIAKENAQDQSAKINFLNFDFLDEASWSSLGKFNIIVSNPPYIPVDEKSKLAKNVVEHEPHLALFVTDEEPFIFYKKIAAFAKKHLNENGKIFVEIHENHGAEIKKVFSQKNFIAEDKKDIYGRERMIKAFK